MDAVTQAAEAQAVAGPFRVGRFEVDPNRNELRLEAQRFPVEPLVMDVLRFLAEHQGEVVKRDELIGHVWFFNRYADESLTRAISMLRGVFRHDGTCKAYIETIWKRGYSLCAAVERGSPPVISTQAVTWEEPGGPGDDYSVAVLGFHNNSLAADDAFLADGITRDLTMLLSRVPRLRVSAYSSAAMWDERKVGLDQISRRLGVRYLVCGSLARHRDDFHVRVGLMDAREDDQVWAQRIDAPLDQFYDVQDRLVLDVSTSLASALQLSFGAARQSRRPFQLSAYELVQRAETLRLHYNRDTALQIISLLDRALAIDPDDAAVHAALAVQHTQNVVSSFSASVGGTFTLAKRHVDRALSIAPQDPDVLSAAGIAATMMGNARLAVHNLTQSVRLDPNNAHALAVLGWQLCWLNGDVAGREMIETAERRAPHHPRYSVWAHYRGHCEIRLGRVEAAIGAYLEGVERNPDYSLNLVCLAAAQALDWRMDEARETVAKVRRIAPNYTPEDFERLADRMVYWFGDRPSRRDMTGALRRVWNS